MDEQIVNVWEVYNTKKNGFCFLDMNEDGPMSRFSTS